MRKTFIRLASKLLTLALLLGCLSLVAPSRQAQADGTDCWGDWVGCMSQCTAPYNYENCATDCDMTVQYCLAVSVFDDGGFKIWP